MLSSLRTVETASMLSGYYLAWSHCLNQSIVNRPAGKKDQQNLNHDIDGLVQVCSKFSVLAMELLQSCTKPLISWRFLSRNAFKYVVYEMSTIVFWLHYVNTLRLRQSGRHFADAIFKCIFLNENVWISIGISLKFVPRGPINNIPALVQIMAWRRSVDKPLSEPMMSILLTHICVIRPLWVNSSPPSQNGYHFANDIFRCIFVNEKFCILIKISLKFVSGCPIRSSDNDSTGLWPPGSLHTLGADGHI